MGIPSPLVFRMLVMVVAGWLRENDALVVAYLREENRVLREQLGDRRLRFSDEQRRRFAVRAHALVRALLGQVATLVTSDTLLRWYRQLVAKKYVSAPASDPCARGVYSRASSKGGVGLLPAPLGSCECGARGWLLVWRPRPNR
jgi:hypothetical protein